MESVASRRPPSMPIHWRTTSRLSSPNLVGVIKLPLGKFTLLYYLYANEKERVVLKI